MPIEVVWADKYGFCAGVSRAIKMAKEAGQKAREETSGPVHALKELVHNRHVVDGLSNLGIQTVQSLEEIPNDVEDATVIVQAHGVTPKVYEEAKARNLKVVDATCPLVAQSHKRVKALAGQGKKILYISSEPTHDEAVGVAGEAPDDVTVTTLKELNKVRIDKPEDIVVLTQTTLSVLETGKALENLKNKYPEITIEPHICLATTERQEAVIKLARDIGFVVVVGSPTSSNSKRLREVAEAAGAQAYIVDTAEELKPEWFKGIKKVGVTSGASTPEDLLEAVVERIKNLK